MTLPQAGMNLAERFAESKGRPIEYGGRAVSLALDIPIVSRTSAKVIRHYARADPVQGVCVKVASGGGRIRLDGDDHKGLVLWADKIAPEFAFEVVPGRTESTLRVWNCWRGKHGNVMAWLGNSGLTYRERAGGFEIEGSDGPGEVSFDAIRFAVLLEGSG